MFDGPKFPRFHWFVCDNDLAFDTLVAEELDVRGQNTARGLSLKDIEIRRSAIRNLLAAVTANGRDGLPIEISIGNDKTITSKYPTGYRTALTHLLNDGWIENPILPNPTGSWDRYDQAQGKINRPKNTRDYRGKIKGSGGCYTLSAKAWVVLQQGCFDAKNIKPSRSHGITVKDHNKASIRPLPICPKVDYWLDLLEQYNNLLTQFDFTLDGDILGANHFTVHRVFNHSGYDQGGRFYSQFVNHSPDARKRLSIDDEPVLSKDFKNLHGRLSLAIIGEPCPDGDLYAFEGFAREDVKAAWSAALNANNNSGVTGAFNSSAIVKAIMARHPKLKEVFGKGLGLYLQRADAEAVSVMLAKFISAGRPLIPCHDGFYLLAQDKVLFDSAIKVATVALFQQLRIRFPDAINISLPVT